VPLSWNLGTLTSWNPLGRSGPVTGLIYLFHNHVNYISFKIVPLCKCKLLPANVNVLETFLEAILWEPFQLFRRILDFRSITMALSLQCWFQLREQVNIGCRQFRTVWGDAPVLSRCSWLRNPRPKTTCVLEHCREGELEPWHVTVPHSLTWPEVNKTGQAMYVYRNIEARTSNHCYVGEIVCCILWV